MTCMVLWQHPTTCSSCGHPVANPHMAYDGDKALGAFCETCCPNDRRAAKQESLFDLGRKEQYE